MTWYLILWYRPTAFNLYTRCLNPCSLSLTSWERFCCKRVEHFHVQSSEISCTFRIPSYWHNVNSAVNCLLMQKIMIVDNISSTFTLAIWTCAWSMTEAFRSKSWIFYIFSNFARRIRNFGFTRWITPKMQENKSNLLIFFNTDFPKAWIWE